MKALVVEDNISILELVSIALQQDGFTTDVAKNGKIALEKVEKNKYDIIILDIMLPKVGGLEVIKSMRATANNTPILAISADCRVETRINAINLGADDFLVKDFNYEELVTRAKGLVRRIATKAPNIIRVQNLRTDISTMIVFYKDKQIHLTKKEFQTLKLLLQNKNTVVTRDDLQSIIWNEHETKMPSNTVTVHIQSLRKKLGEGGKLIHTIHGYGYVIRA